MTLSILVTEDQLHQSRHIGLGKRNETVNETRLGSSTAIKRLMRLLFEQCDSICPKVKTWARIRSIIS